MGSDSGGSSGGYDSGPSNYSRQKKQREQEEKRVQIAEQEDQRGYYARSGSGNIARSLSGSAVTSRAGRETVDNFRSQEVSELYGSQDRMNQAATMQMEYRRQNPQLPSLGGIVGQTLNKIADKNLANMQRQIAAGGKPQFKRTATGRYVATSVNTSGSDDSSPNIQNDPSYGSSDGGDSTGGAGATARKSAISGSEEGMTAAGRRLIGNRASTTTRRKIY